MVVPLIVLGSITKLSFAIAVTHRTRAWWWPGAIAAALGTAGMLAQPTRVIGAISIVLGIAALVVARALRGRS